MGTMMPPYEVIIPVTTYLLQTVMPLRGRALDSFPKGNIEETEVD